MKKKLLIIIGIILLIILFIALFLFIFKKPISTIKTYGNIEIRQVDMSFQVAGIINNVFFEEGDYVKKGDLLATIDDRDYRANYKKA